MKPLPLTDLFMPWLKTLPDDKLNEIYEATLEGKREAEEEIKGLTDNTQ